MKYDYICQDCDTIFEARHAMDHEGPVACPKCSANCTRKVISAPTVIMDWRDSDSVHSSTRFREPVPNAALARKEVNDARST